MIELCKNCFFPRNLLTVALFFVICFLRLARLCMSVSSFIIHCVVQGFTGLPRATISRGYEIYLLPTSMTTSSLCPRFPIFYWKYWMMYLLAFHVIINSSGRGVVRGEPGGAGHANQLRIPSGR